MATISERKNKSGDIISYNIRVYRGYDNAGTRLKPYTMTWKPAPGMTAKQIQKELNKQAVQFEDSCAKGLLGNADRIKLYDFSAQYLDAMRNKLSPVVYESYKRIISETILPALGHHKVSEIKTIHIQEFIKNLSNVPLRQRNGEPYPDSRRQSPATIRRKLAVLQSMLTFALKLGYISNNPADARKLTLPKIEKPEIKIFTKQEASLIISYLQQEPIQFQALIQLAIFSGAREGELVGLKFSDIDFFNNKITISRSAYKLKGQPVKTKCPKSHKSRTISINSACIELLKQLLRDHNCEREKLGTAWKGDNWVFTQWNGEIMHPTTPYKQFEKFQERYNIERRKFHSLRHTSATLLLYNGTDLKTVQERLGHADFTTTNKYLHLIESADNEAVNSLESLLILKKA